MSPPNDAEKLKAIVSSFHQSFDAIQLLSQERLAQPSLIVLYSTIDAAAWLAAESDQTGTRKNFVAWVDRYLLPAPGVDCEALDLYAARCGVLHAFSADSKLQQEGRARPIYYAWGSADKSQLDELLQHMEPGNAIAVHVSDLQRALVAGWNRFADSLNRNPQLVARVIARGGQMFGMIPRGPAERALASFRRDANG